MQDLFKGLLKEANKNLEKRQLLESSSAVKRIYDSFIEVGFEKSEAIQLTIVLMEISL